ncbi:MAG: glycosyltransferase [Bacteroidota bacterium]
MTERKRILVAPLDWGLGHAARCIPVIYELLRQDSEVILAADGRPHDLLRKEFPGLQIIRFPGVSIRYSERSNAAMATVKQLPSFLRGIMQEHAMLEKIIHELNIFAVISDSRYGAYHRSVHSVFIIHQLRILLPSPFAWLENIAALLNKFQIRNFDECWIPDTGSDGSLSGKLSHGISLPRQSFYLGPLSRIRPLSVPQKDFDILVILSGPEPQRTIFEDLVVAQLKKSRYRAFIVRGMPERSVRIKLTDTITAVSSLPSDELSKAIASSHLILARSGYSTIMDLSFAGAKAIFVPTPGQTEQEYLAQHLKNKMICYSEEQKSFDIERSVTASARYSGFTAEANPAPVLTERITALLNRQQRGIQ